MSVESTLVPSEHLARVLTREVTVSSLLAYLAELDATPFLRGLDLNLNAPSFSVEVPVPGVGRIDILISDNGTPAGLIEVKVGAAEHGDQLSRYEAWSSENGGLPCYLVTMDEFCIMGPTAWTHLLLPQVLNLWTLSKNDTARVMASALSASLDDVLSQADRDLGSAGRTAIAIAFRRLAYDVMSDFDRPLTGGAEHTSGGQPSLVVYQTHPTSHTGSEKLCVDLRSEARSSARWPLRLGVEVISGSTAQARADDQARAHALALSMRDALRTSRFVEHLRSCGRSDLADAVSVGKRDGLRAGSDQEAEAWLQSARSMALRKRQRHPVFANDAGRRLVSVSHVKYEQLNRRAIGDLVREGLHYLYAAACTDAPLDGV